MKYKISMIIVRQEEGSYSMRLQHDNTMQDTSIFERLEFLWGSHAYNILYPHIKNILQMTHSI